MTIICREMWTSKRCYTYHRKFLTNSPETCSRLLRDRCACMWSECSSMTSSRTWFRGGCSSCAEWWTRMICHWMWAEKSCNRVARYESSSRDWSRRACTYLYDSTDTWSLTNLSSLSSLTSKWDDERLGISQRDGVQHVLEKLWKIFESWNHRRRESAWRSRPAVQIFLLRKQRG